MVDPDPNPRRDMIARITLPVIVAAFLIQADVMVMSTVERVTLLAVIMLGLILMDVASFCEGMRRAVLVAIAIAIPLATYTYIVSDAQNDTSSNDKRCAAIQRDMLSSHRRLEDGPDVFQALGCRPQGNGIIRVKPTDRELKAGHPLPGGGYTAR